MLHRGGSMMDGLKHGVHIVGDHVPLVDHGHGLELHYVQARDVDYDKAAAELILQLNAADVQQGQLVSIDVHSNGLDDPAVFVAFFCPSLPRLGAPKGKGLKLAFESQLHESYDWKEFYSRSHDTVAAVAPHHTCDPGVRRGQIVAMTGHVSQSFEKHLANTAPPCCAPAPGEDEEGEEGDEYEEGEGSLVSSPEIDSARKSEQESEEEESAMSSPEVASPSPGVDTTPKDPVAAVGATATMAAAETSAMGPGATALLPELSDQADPTTSPLSRQITAARDWLANAEGVVIAASPLVKTATAAEPPPIEGGIDGAVGGIDATEEGTETAAVEVTELGKPPAGLIKGIGGSLLSMGSSLFGANKSTPTPSPGDPEKSASSFV